MNNCSKYSCHDFGLLIIRLAVGGIFLAHGIQKLGNMEMVIGFFASVGIPAFLAYFVAIVETVAGLAMIIGLFTRYAGWLLTIIMLVAIFKVKLSKGFLGGYDFDISLLAMALGLSFTGPGMISLKSCCKCGGKSMCCASGCGKCPSDMSGTNGAAASKSCGCGGNCGCGMQK